MSSLNASQLDALFHQLDQARTVDGPRFKARLRAARARQRRGQPIDRSLAEIQKELARSIDIVQQRTASTPPITYPSELPVAARREQIMQAIAHHRVIVLCGDTGSGKTTQLPKMCLQLGRGARGMIGHTQPRRLAARSVASRIAEELAQPLGQLVGYKIRFNDVTDQRTRIKVMTDGILLAELASDRSLGQYDTLIIDEAHERSLNIDFLLGVLKQLVRKRDDLKLIITSATIDPQRFSAHFDGAPIIQVEGRMYPVEVRYRPLQAQEGDEPRQIVQAIGEALIELKQQDDGDVLVFLPGERDIREAAEVLGGDARIGGEILPLYARLPSAAQQKIFHPEGSPRRVILATNVAETSLTVPRIRHVIDTGLARVSRYAARSKVQRLPIEPISRASADQRKGRCGRLSPGVCIRLYEESEFLARPEFTEPEIQRTNLASVILQMASLGLGDPAEFAFIDPPGARLIRDGYDTLFELGAIDDTGELTKLGRDMARMPVDPRMARLILAGRDEQCLREVLVIAAVLSMQDPRVRPPERQKAADEVHAQWFTGESDFLGYWNLWQWYRKLADRASAGKAWRACVQHFLAPARMREWEELHHQLRDAAADQGMHLNQTPASADAIHRALLTALLSNIGYREEGFEYTGAGGRKFNIFPGSSLFSVRPRWIVAAELIETSKLYAHGVGPIQPQWIEGLAGHLIQHHLSEARWDRDGGRVIADQRTSLFGLTIVPRRVVHMGPIDPVAAREMFIHHGLVEGDMESSAAFFKHNAKLVAEIERLEAKQRKRDLLADPRTRFDFYDQRLPGDVFSRDTLDAWRKKSERENPKVLFMTPELLLAGRSDHITADLYPDQIEARGARLKLQYVAEPGHEDDGVTVKVSIGMLSGLDAQQMDWLVPGLLRDKVEALMRALPKAYRRRFVPIPDFVEKLMPWLEDHRTKPLLVALSDCIMQHTAVEIPIDQWQTGGLEQYLKMNIAVTDEKGAILASGRDLAVLRAQLGAQRQSVIHEAASSKWQRDGITSWDFGPIPESVSVQSRGMAVLGYPALVDQEKSVALRVFDDAAMAAAQSRVGLRRLFALQVGGELAFIEHELEDVEAIAMRLKPVCSRAAVVADALDAAVDVTFIEGQAAVRDAVAFDQRLVDRGSALRATAEQVWGVVGRVAMAYHAASLAVESAPQAWGELRKDVRVQMEQLMSGRWVSGTPWVWLNQMPRYFQGIVRRIEKARDGNLGKDQQRMAELGPYWRAWCAMDESQRRINEHAVRYRWMVEEYRLSLFAQELGTSVKVSPRRLADQARLAGLRID